MKTQFPYVMKAIIHSTCLCVNSFVFVTTPNILGLTSDNLRSRAAFSISKGTFGNIQRQSNVHLLVIRIECFTPQTNAFRNFSGKF